MMRAWWTASVVVGAVLAFSVVVALRVFHFGPPSHGFVPPVSSIPTSGSTTNPSVGHASIAGKSVEIVLPIDYHQYDSSRMIDFGFQIHSDTHQWTTGETVYLSFFRAPDDSRVWTYKTDASWSTTTPDQLPFVKAKVKALPGVAKIGGGFLADVDPEISISPEMTYPNDEPGLLVAHVVIDNTGRGTVTAIESLP